MIRSIGRICVWALLLMALPSPGWAQQGRSVGVTYPPAGTLVVSSEDPRIRRAMRERAVAKVGSDGREFVERYGEEAVAAIFACSKPVAVKLAEFDARGELGKLARPQDLLRVIAQPRQGDDVALWAMQHAGELADADSFEAYLLNPLDYALGLKQLSVGAAEERARRLSLSTATQSAPFQGANDARVLLVGAGVVAIVGLLVWRRRQRP